MLLDFPYLFYKWKLKIKGVVEIGAHYGQEVHAFRSSGVEKIILIEPCSEAFSVLQNKFGSDENIKLFETACGDYNGVGEMNIERNNAGMSNSLLKPKVHLRQHPNIVFTDTEKVLVIRLDDLRFNKEEYNFLNMDAQGFEGRILAGAKETLKHMDYICTEVNRLEMYENNAMVDDLDKILSDFVRVETGWAANHLGWGDAFYIRKSVLNELAEQN